MGKNREDRLTVCCKVSGEESWRVTCIKTIGILAGAWYFSSSRRLVFISTHVTYCSHQDPSLTLRMTVGGGKISRFVTFMERLLDFVKMKDLRL